MPQSTDPARRQRLGLERRRGDPLLDLGVAQCGRHRRELLQRGLEILHDLGGDHLRRRQIFRVLQRLVPQPEDVERRLVARHQLLVVERTEALCLLARGSIIGVVAPDEVVEIRARQLPRLQGEVLVGSEVVDPELLRPGPRPLAIIMSKKAASSLNDDQRRLLSSAAQHVWSSAVQAARDDDAEALPILCSAGVVIDYASEQDLAGLRAAVQPVYDEIGHDPQSKSWLAEIDRLKVQIAASTDVVTCPSKPAPAATAKDGIPQGTYERSFTRAATPSDSRPPHGPCPGRRAPP